MYVLYHFTIFLPIFFYSVITIHMPVVLKCDGPEATRELFLIEMQVRLELYDDYWEDCRERLSRRTAVNLTENIWGSFVQMREENMNWL